MLEYIDSFIENTSPRILPQWNQWVKSLQTFLLPIYKNFVLGTDYETSGMAILRYILSLVDWSYMEKCTSDYERYMFHLRFIKEDLDNTFEHSTTGFRFFNRFTEKNLVKVPEYILPVEDSTVNHLPFDKDWSHWSRVAPVRYLTHDSKELSLYLVTDKVKFFKSPPSYVVITIDVIALVLQYYHYLKECQTEEYMGLDQRRYLHKYVYSHFFTDLLDNFLINQLVLATSITSSEELLSLNTTLSSTQQYGWIGSNYNAAITNLYNECIKIKSGNIRPSALLSASLLGYQKSISTRISFILNHLDIPRLRQYECFRFLRDLYLFKVIFQLFMFRKKDHIFPTLTRSVRPNLQRLVRYKIWEYVHDPSLRIYIEEELDDLLDKCTIFTS